MKRKTKVYIVVGENLNAYTAGFAKAKGVISKDPEAREVVFYECYDHPAKQIKKIRALLDILAEDSNTRDIIIYTHSPYLAQAAELHCIDALKVKVYGVVLDIDPKTEKFEADIKEGDLSNIYNSLLTPIDELEFLQYQISTRKAKNEEL